MHPIQTLRWNLSLAYSLAWYCGIRLVVFSTISFNLTFLKSFRIYPWYLPNFRLPVYRNYKGWSNRVFQKKYFFAYSWLGYFGPRRIRWSNSFFQKTTFSFSKSSLKIFPIFQKCWYLTPTQFDEASTLATVRIRDDANSERWIKMYVLRRREIFNYFKNREKFSNPIWRNKTLFFWKTLLNDPLTVYSALKFPTQA